LKREDEIPARASPLRNSAWRQLLAHFSPSPIAVRDGEVAVFFAVAPQLRRRRRWTTRGHVEHGLLPETLWLIPVY
jgi:hypothetical protein